MVQTFDINYWRPSKNQNKQTKPNTNPKVYRKFYGSEIQSPNSISPKIYNGWHNKTDILQYTDTFYSLKKLKISNFILKIGLKRKRLTTGILKLRIRCDLVNENLRLK